MPQSEIYLFTQCDIQNTGQNTCFLCHNKLMEFLHRCKEEIPDKIEPLLSEQTGRMGLGFLKVSK